MEEVNALGVRSLSLKIGFELRMIASLRHIPAVTAMVSETPVTPICDDKKPAIDSHRAQAGGCIWGVYMCLLFRDRL